MRASQVVNLIKSWEGKNEADGSFKEIIDIYNTQKPLPRGYKVKYTDEWCATTVSAVAVKLGCTDIMPTECSCQKMIDKFKAINCWQENENVIPKAGWIIFYDWQDNGVGDNTGWSDHVGIVIEVKGNQITVIEGNLNNKVGRRALNVNAKYIRGYAMPKYEIEAVATVKPTTTPTVSASTSSKKKPDIIYAVKAGGKWYPEVKNNTDYAGVENKQITDVMIKLSDGTPIKYRVHVKGGNWLPYITGYNKNDDNNGYAGNGKVIDGVEIKCDKYEIGYKVSSTATGTSYYSEVKDSKNDYAGVFGKPVDKLMCRVL